MSPALGLALNLIALLLVVGMSWAALMWMGRRSSHGSHPSLESASQARTSATSATRDVMTGLVRSDGRVGVENFDPTEHCAGCDGVGASSTRGRVVPCAECQGTGVRS